MRDLNLRNVTSYKFLIIYLRFHKTHMDRDIIITYRKEKNKLLKYTCN